jgi:hypothetical protein
LSFGLYTCSGLLTCVGGRPGSFGHWQQDADVFAEWGVDWVKQVSFDANHTCAPYNQRPPQKTNPNPNPKP